MMKKVYIASIMAIIPMAMMAQSPIDAQQISQSDFKGTARFMSMGGAFTALGGDLSTLNQNPAGIGIYRSSEIGVTMDINLQHTKTDMLSNLFPNAASQTKVYCNNFGYVGSTLLDGAMRSFNWGVTFNRAVSFDRIYNGYVPSTMSSLSNYIADFSTGIIAADMGSTDWNKYNPYLDSNPSIDWLSILAYNSYMINPTGQAPGGGNTYEGLYKSDSAADALFTVREKGYVDEYNISFGGNVEDVVYWGLSIGITDLSYKRWAYYSESIANASIPADENASRLTNGSYAFDLNNLKQIDGSGWNLKAGVIVKPINELRIGLAVHTPTFYNLKQSYSATNDFTYTPTTTSGTALGESTTKQEYTDDAYFEWRLNAPWKLMVGVAGVLGRQAIISADYEFQGYNSMNIKVPYYYGGWGEGHDFVSDNGVNDAISSYFKNVNIFRLGAEYRVTPQFSLRAGYNFKTSNVKKEAYDGMIQIQTAGTDPSYTFDDTTQNLSFGLGYRYQSWYIDGAYIYTHRTGAYHAYTNYDNIKAPSVGLKDNNSSIVISTGFKF